MPKRTKFGGRIRPTATISYSGRRTYFNAKCKIPKFCHAVLADAWHSSISSSQALYRLRTSSRYLGAQARQVFGRMRPTATISYSGVHILTQSVKYPSFIMHVLADARHSSISSSQALYRLGTSSRYLGAQARQVWWSHKTYNHY